MEAHVAEYRTRLLQGILVLFHRLTICLGQAIASTGIFCAIMDLSIGAVIRRGYASESGIPSSELILAPNSAFRMDFYLDGISDGVEVAQDQCPLDGSPIFTGVVCSEESTIIVHYLAVWNDVALVAIGAGGIVHVLITAAGKLIRISQTDTLTIGLISAWKRSPTLDKI
jgi:hypothetical protein